LARKIFKQKKKFDDDAVDVMLKTKNSDFAGFCKVLGKFIDYYPSGELVEKPDYDHPYQVVSLTRKRGALSTNKGLPLFEVDGWQFYIREVNDYLALFEGELDRQEFKEKKENFNKADYIDYQNKLKHKYKYLETFPSEEGSPFESRYRKGLLFDAALFQADVVMITKRFEEISTLLKKYKIQKVGDFDIEARITALMDGFLEVALKVELKEDALVDTSDFFSELLDFEKLFGEVWVESLVKNDVTAFENIPPQDVELWVFYDIIEENIDYMFTLNSLAMHFSKDPRVGEE